MAASLFDATLDVLWRQWRAIGGAATGAPVERQVDPEALCLASLTFRDHEPRLWTVLTDWLRTGAPLVSVQRLKNLAVQFPSAERGVKALALVAWHEGKDARWKGLAGGRRAARAGKPVRRRSAGPALDAPPALLLRLRAAFSVGVKADLLAFLLGQRFRVTVATAAASIGYAVPTVFRSLQDLRAAGFVRTAELPTATEYWVDTPDWHGVLGGGGAIAYWGYWREILTYVCAAIALEAGPTYVRATEYARASMLRQLAESHEGALVRSGILERRMPRSPALGEWKEFHAELARRMASDA